MPRYAAFLRAINVGGHTVKMDRLRTLFEEMNLANVKTIIASGNVLFDSPSKNAATLEEKIERQLHMSLGYGVATFVRTAAEVEQIAAYEPFSAAVRPPYHAMYVSFLGADSDAGGAARRPRARDRGRRVPRASTRAVLVAAQVVHRIAHFHGDRRADARHAGDGAQRDDRAEDRAACSAGAK